MPALPASYFLSRVQKSHSHDAYSVPKNYCYGASNTASFDVAYSPHSIFNSFAISSRCTDRSFRQNEDTLPSGSEGESMSSYRQLPLPSVRRNQTCAGFFQTFPVIPSVECENYDPETCKSKNLRKWSSSESIESKPCELGQGYFNENLGKILLNRQHSLVADDQIIDVEYDSDVGWKTKNVRKNPYKKVDDKSDNFEEKVSRERRYSRDSLKLELNRENSRRKKSLEKENLLKVDDRTKLQPSPNRDENFKRKNFEGTVVSPKVTAETVKQKYISEKAVGYENSNKLPKTQKNPFEKCRSTISATSNNSNESLPNDDEIADDVFDSPFSKDTVVASKTQAPKQRRSSSLEALPQKSADSKSHNSSISIKNEPEYFDATKPCKIASPLTTAKPSRGSLKKTLEKRSDYDRDRGRSRHMEGGHRESFKKNDRTNERGSEQDASDRELKDGSLNRSLSNTDTNLEDRIGL